MPPDTRAAYDGDRLERGRYYAGFDVPVVGHVSYQSAGFVLGLVVAGAAGALDWPVVTAVGVGYLLARR
jgi:hypothetical protein